MKKISRMFGGGARVGLLFLTLTLVGSWRQAGATDYGFLDAEGQSATANAIAYYKASAVLAPANTETVKGFAMLAGGLTVPNAGTVFLTHVSSPIGGTIDLNGGTLSLTGSLRIAPTAFNVTTGAGTINGHGGTIFLDTDVTLPSTATGITISPNGVIIDGQGHTLTFNSGTIFTLTNTLTLRNMVIKGLTGTTQFGGTRGLALQNCIIDLSGTAWTYGVTGARMWIHDTVIVQGGGTFKYGSNTDMGLLMIKDFSTLYVAPGTYFRYDSTKRDDLAFTDATGTLHINGGELTVASATAAEGLQLKKGRLFLEGKVSLNNDTNSTAGNGIQLGDGLDASNDVNVKVFPGSYVSVYGYLWHNPA